MEQGSPLRYNEFTELANPLDLLLFRGADFVSGAIRRLEAITTGRDDYSHAGIIVNSAILPHVNGLEDGKLYVWESTMSIDVFGFGDGVPDIESGKGKFGVQIRDLESVVRNYIQAEGAEVAWCKLINNPWTLSSGTGKAMRKKRNKIISNVSNCHRIYGHKKYEFNILSLAASLVPCLRGARDTIESLYLSEDDGTPEQDRQTFVFCSELVALVYREVGVIHRKFDPSNVVPVDFLGCDSDGMPRVVQDPVSIAI